MTDTDTTERVDGTTVPLDLASTDEVVAALAAGQRRAIDALDGAAASLRDAVDAAAARLGEGEGRLMLVGAGASGRLAVQDGAELWPTFGWRASRLVLSIAGGEGALLTSVEGVEDDGDAARAEVARFAPAAPDVVVAVAASGRSPWTVAWLEGARAAGALAIGIANNPGTPLLVAADHPVLLESGPEVLAGSTRMAAGTAQKAALNVFSTALMVRLNRTWGGLMVDMAARNRKLDGRRLRMLRDVLPALSEPEALAALTAADGWVKLAALVASGDTPAAGRARLERHAGSLRRALASI